MIYDKVARYDSIKFAAAISGRRYAVDAGASGGHVTGLLLKLGFDHVLAIEPGPNFELLQARFKQRPITIAQVALGNVHNRMVWFGGEQSHGTPKLWYADANRVGNVRMVRFDNEFSRIPHVDLVKLDIEGGEHDALRGMETTLTTHHPIVVCETADWLVQQKDGPGRAALFDYMASLGYEVAARFAVDTVWRYRGMPTAQDTPANPV